MAGGVLFFGPRTQARVCASKPRYRSRARARRVAKLIRSHNGPKFYEYPCPVCGGWHLTELEQRGKR